KWDIRQLESRQDKTIVEHVHVLEEAKRVTDRQLADAQKELESNAAYIRSLEKAKARLASEVEDLTRATEKENVEIRTKEKTVRSQEERTARALREVEKERKGREAAEAYVRKLQNEVKAAHDQTVDVTQQLSRARAAKDQLETDLARLADETETPNSMAKVTRQYETKVADLQMQLEDALLAKDTAARIQEQVNRQHAEIRRLVMSAGPSDDAFRHNLLRELQRADEEIVNSGSARSRSSLGGSDVRTLANLTPTKRTGPNGVLRPRSDSQAPSPRKTDSQVAALKQQVQGLELKMMASQRIRQHLESSLHELNKELETNQDSKQFFQRFKQRIGSDNHRLAVLLEEEKEARKHAEAAQFDGVQAMWAKFENTIAAERESYLRLEDSRKALQRTAQGEIEESRRQVQELNNSKKQLQSEVATLRERLDSELVAKSNETNARRNAQARLQELEVSSSSSSAMESELRVAVEEIKAKAETYRRRLEAAELERVQSESTLRRSHSDVKKQLAALALEHDATEVKLKNAEAQVRELTSRLEEGDLESSDLAVLRQRLAEEMDDERRRYQKELEDRDFEANQTQKKYQAELAQLTEELHSQRENITKARDELRKARSDHDELLLRYDAEVYSNRTWKGDQERLHTKIAEMTKAYDASISRQTEQQSQIVALHSQVRELRSVLNDAEADRTLLQNARRALQKELEIIKIDTVGTDKMTSEQQLQMMQMKKQDLERTLEEHADRAAVALQQMEKAEDYAKEAKLELGEARQEISKLDKENVRALCANVLSDADIALSLEQP
ncbi:hypothetical protein FA95DRAFT_1502887, partial [Auriscalpium vulgare]